MHVLGIDVPGELLARWRRLLAPVWQPFFVRPEDGFSAAVSSEVPELTADLRCTYAGWRIRNATSVVWFDEESFMALARPDRARLARSQVERGRGAVPTVRRWKADYDDARLRDQADGHRFVWWPSLLDDNPEPALRAQIEDGQLASYHRRVDEPTWRRCAPIVPNAREIAGTFPTSAGPNCFGATLASVGRAGIGSRAVHEPFEQFLETWCVSGGRDGDPGTVLVWSGADGRPSHSAVTLGDGWGLEKPSETWWTPTVVAPVPELIRVNRSVGLRLERHRLRSVVPEP